MVTVRVSRLVKRMLPAKPIAEAAAAMHARVDLHEAGPRDDEDA
jgi:hypothetical protein